MHKSRTLDVLSEFQHPQHRHADAERAPSKIEHRHKLGMHLKGMGSKKITAPVMTKLLRRIVHKDHFLDALDQIDNHRKHTNRTNRRKKRVDKHSNQYQFNSVQFSRDQAITEAVKRSGAPRPLIEMYFRAFERRDLLNEKMATSDELRRAGEAQQAIQLKTAKERGWKDPSEQKRQSEADVAALRAKLKADREKAAQPRKADWEASKAAMQAKADAYNQRRQQGQETEETPEERRQRFQRELAATGSTGRISGTGQLKAPRGPGILSRAGSALSRLGTKLRGQRGAGPAPDNDAASDGNPYGGDEPSPWLAARERRAAAGNPDPTRDSYDDYQKAGWLAPGKAARAAFDAFKAYKGYGQRKGPPKTFAHKAIAGAEAYGKQRGWFKGADDYDTLKTLPEKGKLIKDEPGELPVIPPRAKLIKDAPAARQAQGQTIQQPAAQRHSPDVYDPELTRSPAEMRAAGEEEPKTRSYALGSKTMGNLSKLGANIAAGKTAGGTKVAKTLNPENFRVTPRDPVGVAGPAKRTVAGAGSMGGLAKKKRPGEVAPKLSKKQMRALKKEAKREKQARRLAKQRAEEEKAKEAQRIADEQARRAATG